MTVEGGRWRSALRQRPLLLAVLLAAVLLPSSASAGGSSAAGGARAATSVTALHLVLYSMIADQQFVNNEDDRGRGIGNNPFGNFRGSGLPTTNEHVGPFPGDEGVYSYGLYTSAALKTRVGSALFICTYVFAKVGFCDVSYTLAQGSLIGVGEVPALAQKHFEIAITGGTGAYAGAHGLLDAYADSVIPSVAEIQVVSHDVPTLQLSSQRLVLDVTHPAAAASRPAAGAHTFTIYSLADVEQYIDNADDEFRGWTANPWGLRDRRVQFQESQGKGGPYPGDAAYFTFTLYADAHLSKRIGSAVYSCLYAFDKNAYCDATFQLAKGTLTGGSEFGFDDTHFAFAITGGTRGYLSLHGEADESPVGVPGKQVQRLDFVLQPS